MNNNREIKTVQGYIRINGYLCDTEKYSDNIKSVKFVPTREFLTHLFNKGIK